ncbi:Gentisate 1,2-dioxygenase [Polaromonas sp. OV174]|uniref:cupin domain-containing protein n=1 Tax=Polaromonas sp. OV174 TaxID=1855300 RepID=UPI0008E0E5AB|nr:hypothetical protein [Polaromonas sp. OV174]SFB89971.1 Gentisate 1,2-dioxygenase [Polaromonas sp. OV174]
MSGRGKNFLDVCGAAPRVQNTWAPLVVSKQEINLEVERLIDAAKPDNGRRASMVVHPEADKQSKGFAPGIDVTIHVLKPGERTRNLRKNSNMVEICVAGSGTASVGGKVTKAEKWDVWNTPSMRVHNYYNDGKEPWVWLTYSNAPLLEKLEVHYVEEFDGATPPSDMDTKQTTRDPGKIARARDLALKTKISEDGAHLLGYEWLIDIDTVESKSLHWPWNKVSSYFPDITEIGKEYNGRRLFVLYNPVTERRIGTTPSFFASLSCSLPNSNNIAHRHSSSSINYYLRGGGHSMVDGQRLDWQAGDLMLSAPGWAMHSHHIGDSQVSTLTIQDHPFQIAVESLIWQERIEEPILALGNQVGFESNRASVGTR